MSKTVGVLIFVLAGGVALAVTVPDGGSVNVTQNKPENPPAPPSGAPGGTAWAPGTPRMFEVDPVSENDDMGPATDNGDGTATGTVTNSGGDLFGPMGGVQNGFGEGDCIEVQIGWPYYTWEFRSGTTPTFDPPGVIYWEKWVRVTKYYGTETVEVCPEDE